MLNWTGEVGPAILACLGTVLSLSSVGGIWTFGKSNSPYIIIYSLVALVIVKYPVFITDIVTYA